MTTDSVDQENAEQKPGSLTHHITFLFQEAGVTNPEQWMALLNPIAQQSTDVRVQRFHINRCLLKTFGQLRDDADLLETRDARGCLMNGECPLDEYLDLFKKVVIPCLIRKGLLTAQP